MIAKLFAIVAFSFCIGNTYAQDTAKIVARSKTVPVTVEDAAKADQDALNYISNTTSHDAFFNRFTIIGPKLWDKIKGLPQFKNVQQGNTTFKVPKLEADGSWKKTEGIPAKVFQTEKDFNNLSAYLETTWSVSKGKLSPMNQTDKFICWQYFAKIEEGARIVEINSTRLMLHFTEGKLFFIELTAE